MKTIRWKQATGLGLLSWLLPFAISLALYPVKLANAPLFGSAMTLVLIALAAILARRYFRDGAPGTREAAVLGLLWLTMNLILDYPMFAFGPMKMTAGHYYSEIGSAYLLYPTFLVGMTMVKRV
jgi:hypothetical protein